MGRGEDAEVHTESGLHVETCQPKPPRHAYVHFSDNAAAKKARKEKDGGAIGKALASCLLNLTHPLPVY